MIVPIFFNLDLRKCEVCLGPAAVAVHDEAESLPSVINGKLWPNFIPDGDPVFLCRRHARPARVTRRLYSDIQLLSLCQKHGIDPTSWPSLSQRNAEQKFLFDEALVEAG
jgi:hypothetical protein